MKLATTSAYGVETLGSFAPSGAQTLYPSLMPYVDADGRPPDRGDELIAG